MAELLIRVTDKINSDFYLNTKCTKRGDVIVARPDGWNWGKDELSLPFWRIVKIPAMDLATAESFLAPEVDADPKQPSKTLQRRVVKFDLDNVNLPDAFKQCIADDKRAVPFLVLKELPQNVSDPQKEAAFPASDFAANKVVKQPISDPAVIGSDAAVIG